MCIGDCGEDKNAMAQTLNCASDDSRYFLSNYPLQYSFFPYLLCGLALKLPKKWSNAVTMFLWHEGALYCQ